MFAFKNITILKELEKKKALENISKLAYFQVTHELLTPVSVIIPLLIEIKKKLPPTMTEVYEYFEMCWH